MFKVESDIEMTIAKLTNDIMHCIFLEIFSVLDIFKTPVYVIVLCLWVPNEARNISKSIFY